MEILQDNFVDPFALTHVNVHRINYDTIELTDKYVFSLDSSKPVTVPPSNDLSNTVVRASCTYADVNIFSGKVHPERERVFTCTYVSGVQGDVNVLVTNFHNIASHVQGSIFVSYKDTTTKMYVAFCNPDLDIAFLEPEASTNLHKLESIRVYDNNLDAPIAVYGVVDNVLPYIGLVEGQVGRTTIRMNGRDYAKHSAIGISSMSGGPIITRQGVIGIYNHRAASVSGSDTYFVPGRVLNRLLRQFATSRKNRATVIDRLGQWGIRSQTGNVAANRYNGNTLCSVSMCVTHMLNNSALNGDDRFSGTSMLECGDNIVSVDGVFLDEYGVSTNTNQTFVEMIDEKPLGSTIDIKVMRSGTNKIVRHRLGNVRPVRVTSEFTNDGYKFFDYGGVRFTQLTMNHIVALYKQLPHLWKYTDNDLITTGHVMITSFDRHNIIGPDVRLGAVIYSIDGSRIRTLSEIHKSFSQSSLQHVTLTMCPTGNVTVPTTFENRDVKVNKVIPPPTVVPDIKSLTIDNKSLDKSLDTSVDTSLDTSVDTSLDTSVDNLVDDLVDDSLDVEEEEEDDFDNWF